MTTPEAVRGALLLALRGGGIRDLALLRAMETVPREEFLPPALRHLAGRDMALPLACGQTIPSPLALARMIEVLAPRAEDRVLEIGTGSGYAAAVVAQLSRAIVSFERYRTLAEDAQARLDALGITACIVHGDGLAFPAEFGRFDCIVVHGALTHVPRSLGEALADEGRIVSGIVDKDGTSLAVFTRDGDGFACRRVMPMRFAPVRRDLAQAL